jgi:hypothetical protein
MTRMTDEAYVVIDRKQVRSVLMEGRLLRLLETGYSLRQILLLSSVEPGLTESQLSDAQLDDAALSSIFKRSIVHAMRKASAKLLMTLTREHQIGNYSSSEHTLSIRLSQL